MTREEFEALYNEKLDDIMKSSSNMHAMRVGAWLHLLEQVPSVQAYVQRAEGQVFFEEWYARATSPGQEMADLYSPDTLPRMGQFLGLMRKFAEKGGWSEIALNHYRVTNGGQAALDMVNRNLVGPFARDLLRELAPLVRDAEQAAPPRTAASVITIDPQSPAIREIKAKLDELLTIVRSSNSAGEILGEEKDRVDAQLSASKELIRVTRVDPSILHTVIAPTLKYTAEKLADQGADAIVKLLVTLLATALGINIAL